MYIISLLSAVIARFIHEQDTSLVGGSNFTFVKTKTKVKMGKSTLLTVPMKANENS